MFIRVAAEFLADRNSARKKRKIRNFPEYPVSQWTIPIRYKIDNTFSKFVAILFKLRPDNLDNKRWLSNSSITKGSERAGEQRSNESIKKTKPGLLVAPLTREL